MIRRGGFTLYFGLFIYRIELLSSCSISSVVVIILVAAENARCVMIMLENSVAISVAEFSTADPTRVPAPLVPDILAIPIPEAAVSANKFPERARKPLGLAKVNTGTWYRARVSPFE